MLVELFWRSCFGIATMACSDPGQHAMGSNGPWYTHQLSGRFAAPNSPRSGAPFPSHLSLSFLARAGQGSLTRQRDTLARGSEETHDLAHERTWYMILSSTSLRRSSIMASREMGVSLAITITSRLRTFFHWARKTKGLKTGIGSTVQATSSSVQSRYSTAQHSTA